MIKELMDRAGNYLMTHKTIAGTIIFAGLMIGFMFLIIMLIQKSSKKLKDSKHSYLTHNGKRYTRDYANNKFTKWMDDTFKYSRIYKTKFGAKFVRTSIRYFVLALSTSALAMAIVAGTTRKLLFSIFIFFAAFSAWYIGIFLIRLTNKKLVTNELMNFLNLLGNYSTTNTEIVSMLTQIAPQVGEPLRDCLLECVAESQDTNKDKTVALQNLANKIEDRKFKEIIKNLEIAQNNEGSYSQIVSANRHSLIEYIHGKKLKAGIARENLISFFVILAAVIGIVFMMGKIIGINVFASLISTVAGIVVLSIASITSLYFIISAISAGR